MRRFQVALLCLAVWLATPLQAQETVAQTRDGAEIRIRLDGDDARRVRARDKLVRLLARYDLRPWVFTNELVITNEGIPHSHPVLTLTTESECFDDDLCQLSAFVHEQLHWFEEALENAPGVERAIERLRQRYPEVPVRGGQGARSEYSTYLHLVVIWQQLDALVELVGEEVARRVLSSQDHYRWIYATVLEDAEAIGAIVAAEGLAITPSKGLVVEPPEGS